MQYFPWRPQTLLSFSGKDRHKLLQNLVTQDVRQLSPDHSIETFVTDVKGRTIAHGFLFEDGDSTMLATSPGIGETLAKHFDRYIIREEVTVEDHSSRYEWWISPSGYLDGIDEDRIEPQSLERLRCRTSSWVVDQVVSRVLHFGWPVLGKDCVVARIPIEMADSFRAKIGSRWNASNEELESLRVAARWPYFAIDFGPENLPQEVDRDALAICFTKGCYLGQETVARLDALGQVQKKLCLVEFPDSHQISAGDIAVSDGREVGKLTSVARSSNGTLALAMLRRSHFPPGSTLTVNDQFGIVQANPS